MSVEAPPNEFSQWLIAAGLHVDREGPWLYLDTESEEWKLVEGSPREFAEAILAYLLRGQAGR